MWIEAWLRFCVRRLRVEERQVTVGDRCELNRSSVRCDLAGVPKKTIGPCRSSQGQWEPTFRLFRLFPKRGNPEHDQGNPDYTHIKSSNAGPISLSGRIALTHPVWMAALGIPGASAVLGSWAMT